MRLNNKGSILIITLIIFTIISVICTMCINLIYMNNNIFELDYENIKLREQSLSGIEIVYSNILNNVKKAVESSKNEDDFKNYFLGNNYCEFIEKIGDIPKGSLDNVEIEILNPEVFEGEEIFKFKIMSKVKEDLYMKNIEVNVKIKNPWYEINKEADNQILENTNLIKSTPNIEDYREIVLLYDYKEI